MSRRAVLNVVVPALVMLAMEGACLLRENTTKYRRSELTAYELVPGVDRGDEVVNAAGLRGAELRPRDEVSPRILCMGGSTTWGHKVDEDETWPMALQASLVNAGFPRAEVLNGGVSGWGLEQIVLALENGRMERLRPDLVIVYSGWNYAELADNPIVARFTPHLAGTPPRTPLHRSALVRWLDDQLQDLRTRPAPPPADRAARQARTREVMERAFPGLCERLAALSRREGVPVVMVRYPGLVQVPPAEGVSRDSAYVARLVSGQPDGVASEGLEEQALAQWEHGIAVVDAAAAAAGLPVLDVAGELLDSVDAQPGAARRERWLALFRDRMHLTPEGNRAVGEAVARLLARQGLLPE